MTTKHTPGPWRYEAGRDGRPPYVIRGTEGGFVVVGMTADRQEADARLIAAAPELLQALEAIVNDPYVAALGSLGMRAKRVIAKARGEQ